MWETIVSYDVLFHQEEHPYPLNMSVDEQEYHGGGRLRIVSTQVPIISGWICPPTISCRPTGAREEHVHRNRGWHDSGAKGPRKGVITVTWCAQISEFDIYECYWMFILWIIMCDFHFDIYLLTPFSHYEVHLFLQVLLPSCRVLPPSTFITVGLFMFNPRL